MIPDVTSFSCTRFSGRKDWKTFGGPFSSEFGPRCKHGQVVNVPLLLAFRPLWDFLFQSSHATFPPSPDWQQPFCRHPSGKRFFVGLQAGGGAPSFSQHASGPHAKNYPTMDCAIFHETSNLMPLPHDCFTPPGGSHGQRPSLLHSPRRFLGNMWPSSSGPAASTMVVDTICSSGYVL